MMKLTTTELAQMLENIEGILTELGEQRKLTGKDYAIAGGAGVGAGTLAGGATWAGGVGRSGFAIWKPKMDGTDRLDRAEGRMRERFDRRHKEWLSSTKKTVRAQDRVTRMYGKVSAKEAAERKLHGGWPTLGDEVREVRQYKKAKLIRGERESRRDKAAVAAHHSGRGRIGRNIEKLEGIVQKKSDRAVKVSNRLGGAAAIGTGVLVSGGILAARKRRQEKQQQLSARYILTELGEQRKLTGKDYAIAGGAGVGAGALAGYATRAGADISAGRSIWKPKGRTRTGEGQFANEGDGSDPAAMKKAYSPRWRNAALIAGGLAVGGAGLLPRMKALGGKGLLGPGKASANNTARRIQQEKRKETAARQAEGARERARSSAQPASAQPGGARERARSSAAQPAAAKRTRGRLVRKKPQNELAALLDTIVMLNRRISEREYRL